MTVHYFKCINMYNHIIMSVNSSTYEMPVIYKVTIENKKCKKNLFSLLEMVQPENKCLTLDYCNLKLNTLNMLMDMEIA